MTATHKSKATVSRLYAVWTILVLVFALSVTTGCDSNDPNAEPIDFTGQWIGKLTHPTFSGALEMNLIEVNASVGGTWSWRYEGGAVSGTVLGERTHGDNVRLLLTQTGGRSNCTMIFDGGMRRADELVGSYVNDQGTCRTPAAGTIATSRQ